MLEVTFLFGDLVHELAMTLDSLLSKWEGAELTGRPSTSRRLVAVWDFSRAASVQEAAAKLEATRLGRHPSPSHVSSPLARVARPWEHMRLALSGAVNCRSFLSETPLHVAAVAGDLPKIRGLLQLGADVHQRGPRGSSALFVACEKGYAAAANLLLQHGADPWVSNKYVETPVYIAALKGHNEVIRRLLQHFAKHETQWWLAEMYGDGWTPLMAVAVSNHVTVGKELLEFAEEQSPGAGVQLVHAKNQYGQTAAHICARKNQCRLLRAICHVGGAAVVGVRDTNGRSALDIAVENRSKAAELLLREYTGEGEMGGDRAKGSVGGVGRGGGGKRVGRR